MKENKKSKNNKNNKNKEENKHSKRRLIASASVTAVLLALVIGLSYAWFFNQSNMATLISISPPSPIAIKGAHGQTLSLDLNYTDADKDPETKKVTIRRVISIENGGANHKIEIVHTTNLKGLTFKLYAATEVKSGEISGDEISESGFVYQYDQNNPIAGHYINAENATAEYKSAVDNSDASSKHSKNYDKYEKVQAHAEPIYWIVDSPLRASGTAASQNISPEEDTEEKQKCLTYYVLEISWTETEKETDIFYVLAKDE